jgi:hypothetical protein
MARIPFQLILAAAVTAASVAYAQPPPPTAPPVGPMSPPAAIAPAAPAFKVGAVVTDRTGARVGTIQSLGDAPRGPMVVIAIDGKLVSVPQSTLTLKDDGVVSLQTKAEILAATGAPR